METIKLANMPLWMTPKQVAQILRVSELTVKRWEKKGTLVPVRINKRGDRVYHRDKVRHLLGEI